MTDIEILRVNENDICIYEGMQPSSFNAKAIELLCQKYDKWKVGKQILSITPEHHFSLSIEGSHYWAFIIIYERNEK